MIIFISQHNLPEFASCIMFELHNINGNYVIKIFYKKNVNDSVSTQIPNSKTDFPMRKFLKIYKDVLPMKNYETECKLRK